ncbi:MULTISPECIES: class I SAM-dependent methyltransferase [Okeania]|uniref:Methyltransferase domain-containing protein n=1 Tax=Okeania hirsuta TaxID=1458930 RepID=A0A3N6PQI7_9CYAN|nr:MULTISPECIES: class I SAM-dependent methyltransferase [Okeania]NET14789.1 class I SAM-dependent methyltransferase [Okeania sp. SIO1H6]NES78680.1 class I SAM-dependent methyltransferase [Okeania sp. SIO1H4]NES91958.1 class I SAM-dependent methyltransferase [Okeania sp. SIO2B9]NET22191.1 class I SAM-dependent methyltransferase [Okeania sp. SIO1H5]NET79060.1 class I SAM-dependent methyltransferase [Okeania sp. SIO1F9]
MNEIKIQRQYDELANIYDLRWRNYIINTLTFLHNWEQIEPQASILDVACGTGEFERLLLDKNLKQEIIGVDISENMLNVARKKYQAYSNVKFQQASVHSLPFNSHSFDVVVCANSFHFFDKPQVALGEMKRVLKPNGKVIIIDWNKDYFVCRICDWFLQIFDPAHQQCYTQAELHQLLVSAQFEVHSATKFRLGVIWGMMAVTAFFRSQESGVRSQ